MATSEDVREFFEEWFIPVKEEPDEQLDDWGLIADRSVALHLRA